MPQDPAPSLPMRSRERRFLRSDNPYEAVQIYLTVQRHQLGLQAVALADDQGLPLAGSAGARELELLALFGTLGSTERARYRDEFEAHYRDASCSSHQFELEGTRFTVTAVGSGSSATIVDDLKRILSNRGIEPN